MPARHGCSTRESGDLPPSQGEVVEIGDGFTVCYLATMSYSCLMSGRRADEDRYMTASLALWRKRTDWPLMALAIGSLPVLIIETKVGFLPWFDRLFVTIVNVVVLAAFATDYIVELMLASNRRIYVRREYLSLLIVVAQVLALVPTLAVFGAIRGVRAARLFRLFGIVARATAITGNASRAGRSMIREHAAGLAFAVAAMTWLTSAAAFTVAEDVGRGRRVHSFFDSLWWSLGTITTAGAGEIYPVTASGRIVGGVTMVVGISTFAVITAKVAQFLIRPDDPDSNTSEGVSE